MVLHRLHTINHNILGTDILHPLITISLLVDGLNIINHQHLLIRDMVHLHLTRCHQVLNNTVLTQDLHKEERVSLLKIPFQTKHNNNININSSRVILDTLAMDNLLLHLLSMVIRDNNNTGILPLPQRDNIVSSLHLRGDILTIDNNHNQIIELMVLNKDLLHHNLHNNRVISRQVSLDILPNLLPLDLLQRLLPNREVGLQDL